MMIALSTFIQRVEESDNIPEERLAEWLLSAGDETRKGVSGNIHANPTLVTIIFSLGYSF